MRTKTLVIFATLLAMATIVFAQFPGMRMTPAQRARFEARQKATKADYERMVDILHIKSMRPGADGNNPKAPNYENIDEAKANPYPNLPNPLISNSGVHITTPAQWWHLRRPEIVADFNRDVYGYVPLNVPKVTWIEVSQEEGKSGDVPTITKHLIGHVDNSIYPAIKLNIPVTLVLPADASGPVPVLIRFGFNFSPAMLKRFRAMMKARGIKPPAQPAGPSTDQQLLNADWGYATLSPTDVQADNGAGLDSGIIGLVDRGKPRRPYEWGALRAWAWGASRVLDYLETDPAVNAKEVGIEGLSRYGKATLVTMAYDQRFAIALVGSSGKGGAALYRRHWGEEMGNIAGMGEYHWFAGNFLKYDGPLNASDMPVDSHELMAMCAPRPIFISYGNPKVGRGFEGPWVDPKGSYMAAVAAGPVYELLGKKGLPDPTIPALGVSELSGDIGWREHFGPHTDVPNWPAFMKFAAKYIKAPPHKK